MAELSPDEKFLLVGTTFDQPPATNLDGSPILSVQRHGAPRSIASNAPDPDGLAVLRIGEDGTLGPVSFHDGGGASPWFISFLHGRPNTFVIAATVGDGLLMGDLDEDGEIALGPLVPLDTNSP